MHIKETRDGLYLAHCSWQLSRFCDDKDRNIKQEAEKLDIPVDKITSGICRACGAVMARNEGLKLEPFEKTLLELEDEEDTTTVEELIRQAIAESIKEVQQGKISKREYKKRIYTLTSIQAKL